MARPKKRPLAENNGEAKTVPPKRQKKKNSPQASIAQPVHEVPAETPMITENETAFAESKKVIVFDNAEIKPFCSIREHHHSESDIVDTGHIVKPQMNHIDANCGLISLSIGRILSPRIGPKISSTCRLLEHLELELPETIQFLEFDTSNLKCLRLKGGYGRGKTAYALKLLQESNQKLLHLELPEGFFVQSLIPTSDESSLESRIKLLVERAPLLVSLTIGLIPSDLFKYFHTLNKLVSLRLWVRCVSDLEVLIKSIPTSVKFLKLKVNVDCLHGQRDQFVLALQKFSTRLVSLEIVGDTITSDILNALSRFCPRLQSLVTMVDSSIDDKALFPSLTNLTCLEELKVYGDAFSAARLTSSGLLGALNSCKNLTDVYLDRLKVRNAALVISELISYTNVATRPTKARFQFVCDEESYLRMESELLTSKPKNLNIILVKTHDLFNSLEPES